MRYIDADKLVEMYERSAEDDWNKKTAPSSWAEAFECAIADIDDQPTADVVPKSEVEKIFEEIETCMKDFEDDDDGYLLKKCEFEFFMREIKEKYAEQEKIFLRNFQKGVDKRKKMVYNIGVLKRYTNGIAYNRYFAYGALCRRFKSYPTDQSVGSSVGRARL